MQTVSTPPPSICQYMLLRPFFYRLLRIGERFCVVSHRAAYFLCSGNRGIIVTNLLTLRPAFGANPRPVRRLEGVFTNLLTFHKSLNLSEHKSLNPSTCLRRKSKACKEVRGGFHKSLNFSQI